MTNPIAEKIQKLFDKASSTNFQEEADALLLKARALMEKHQISTADLEKAQKDQGAGRLDFNTYRSKQFQWGTPAHLPYRLEAAVYRFFGCKVIVIHHGRRLPADKQRASYEFHGETMAMDLAQSFYHYLWKTVGRVAQDLWGQSRNRRGDSEAEKRKFIRNMIVDITLVLLNRLSELAAARKREVEEKDSDPNSRALVVLNLQLEEYVDNFYGEAVVPATLKTPLFSNRMVDSRAWDAAHKISLDNQIAGPEAKTPYTPIGNGGGTGA